MQTNNTFNDNEYDVNSGKHKEYSASSTKSQLRRGLEYLTLTAALAFFAPSAPSNPMQAQENKDKQSSVQEQSSVQDSIRTATKTGANILYKDTCYEDNGNCPPKYKELNFTRKSSKPTFSSKEVWTLDKGDGTEMLVLKCDSPSINNLLELVDFKYKTIKNSISSHKYKTIEDNLDREYLKIETENGTRYFTIQEMDKENKGIIDIDGAIHYDMLKNRGDRTLRLKIQVGEYAGMDPKTGRIMIRSLDSGEIPVVYYDCKQPLVISNSNIIHSNNSDDLPTGNSSINIININNDYSTKINITVENGAEKTSEKVIGTGDTLKSDRLVVSVLGSFANDARQKKFYDCGEFDIHTRPMIWKMAAYARTLDDLHINAEFTHLHSQASLSDSVRNNVGRYGITADDLLLDIRYNILSSSEIGLGIGGIFEYNASTQKGSAQRHTLDANQYTLDANDSRISGLLGLVLFIDDAKLSLGAYAGHSSQLGRLLNATARLNDIQIGKILEINSRLFLEMYKGDYGKGHRFGFEALVSGPQLLGFLRPTIGYEIVQTIYSGNDSGLEKGLRRSILVGVTADLGKSHRSSHKSSK